MPASLGIKGHARYSQLALTSENPCIFINNCVFNLALLAVYPIEYDHFCALFWCVIMLFNYGFIDHIDLLSSWLHHWMILVKLTKTICPCDFSIPKTIFMISKCGRCDSDLLIVTCLMFNTPSFLVSMYMLPSNTKSRKPLFNTMRPGDAHMRQRNGSPMGMVMDCTTRSINEILFLIKIRQL